MKNFFLLVAGFLICLSACTGDDATTAPAARSTGKAVPRPPGNSPPKVTSGSIHPEAPTAVQKLTVQYVCTDPEDDPIQYTFRWFVNGELVQEGSRNTLDPGLFQKESKVYAEIIPADKYSSGGPMSTESVTVRNIPPVIESVSLTPVDPPAGEIITAEPVSKDPDGEEVRYKYQWYVNGQPVTELQESNQFKTKGLKKRDIVHAVVIPSDFDSEGVPKNSDVVMVTNNAPNITSSPPHSLEDGRYAYQVTAKDPDGDKLTYKLLAFPPGMTINANTGLIQWAPPKEMTGKQDVPVKISVEDGDGGSVTQTFSLTLQPK